MTTNKFLSFLERHSLGIRVWHWCFALLITSTILVVALASTLFKTRSNISMVQDELQQKSVSVNPDQARAVAHAFNDRLWELHTWIGYGIAALLLLRLVIEFSHRREERLLNRIRRALALPVSHNERRHYLQVKRIYLVFYILIFIMAVTGLVLAFEDVAALRPVRGLAKQLHSFGQYGIYGFVIVHLAGVTLAETGSNPGVVSGMIHGNKRNKDD